MTGTQTIAAIGPHPGLLVGDLLRLEIRGSLTVADVAALQRAVREVLDAHDSCFLLADLTHMTGLEAEARRLMAQWSKDHTEQVSGVALYGCNFATRALLTLTLNAIKFLGQQQVPTVFVRDEAEGRAWIEGRRALLPGGAV